MFRLLYSLRGLIKPKSIVTEGFIFRLHTQLTVALLIVFSVLVTARQYIGDPIDCIAPKKFPKELLDTYCWIHGTFSLVDEWHKKVGIEIIYPGIAKSVEKSAKVYHMYYQWVCFVLFIQALFFYAPHYYWKNCERKRIKSILLELDRPLMNEEIRLERMNLLVNYLKVNLHNHQILALHYYFTEMCLLINVIIQMFLMDLFLGGEFTSYGIKVMEFTEWDPSVLFDPMLKVFPRLAKCKFHDFGSSGDVQKYDTLCILPINVINEKIYIILWFWFYFLQIITTLLLIYRMLTLLLPPLRYYILKLKATRSKPDYIKIVLSKCSIGDWFVLILLQKNMDPFNFSQIIELFASSLRVNNKDNQRMSQKINIAEGDILSTSSV